MSEKITKEHLSDYHSYPDNRFSVECILPFVIDNKSILLIGNYDRFKQPQYPVKFNEKIINNGGAGIDNIYLEEIRLKYNLNNHPEPNLVTIRATVNDFTSKVFQVDSEILQATDCLGIDNEVYDSDLDLSSESNRGYVKFCTNCPVRLNVLNVFDHYLDRQSKDKKKNKNQEYKSRFITSREYYVKTLPDEYLDIPLNSLGLSLPTSQALIENGLSVIKDVLALDDEELKNLNNFNKESFREWKEKLIDLILSAEIESKKNS